MHSHWQTLQRKGIVRAGLLALEHLLEETTVGKLFAALKITKTILYYRC